MGKWYRFFLRFIEDLSIELKFLVLFGVVFLLITFEVGVSVWNMKNISSGYEIVLKAKDIMTSFNKLLYKEKEYIDTLSEAKLAEFIEVTNDISTKFTMIMNSDFEFVKKYSYDGKKTTEKYINEFFKTIEEFKKDYREIKDKEAKKKLVENVKRKVDKLHGYYSKLIEKNLILLSQRVYNHLEWIKRLSIYVFVISYVMLLVVFVVISLLAQKVIVSPINSLKKAMAEFADKGIVDTHIREDRKDEIGVLNSEFINMAKSIVRYQHHLEDLVKQRTEELNKAMLELKKKNDLMEWELNIAKNVQRNIIPKASLKWKQFKVSFFYLPLEKVGGDFFSYGLTYNKKFAVFLADVSGHGVPAALITTMLKILFSSAILSTDSPSEILSYMGNYIYNSVKGEVYFTGLAIVIDSNGKVVFSSGGHPPIIHFISKEEDFSLYDATGVPLGIQNTTKDLVGESGFKIGDNDLIFLYTDGITELKGKNNEMLEQEGFVRVLRKYVSKSPKEIINFAIKDVLDFSGGVRNDDISLIVVKKVHG